MLARLSSLALLLAAALPLAPALAEGPAQQMTGQWAEIGKLYKLGAEGTHAIHFQLDSAEFTVAPVVIDNRLVDCGANEKILLIHFTLQNGLDTERRTTHTDLTFTAVDAQNANHEEFPSWGVEETHESLNLGLKPAQKIAGYAAIVTDAVGPIPKLIVEPLQGEVLRYDLKTVATPLPAPIADPADTTGTTALATVPGALNAAYPLRTLTMTMTAVAIDPAPIKNKTPKADSTFLRAHFTLKNESPTAMRLNQSQLESLVVLPSGRKLPHTGQLYWEGSEDIMSGMIEPGDSGQFWLAYEIPVEHAGATLTIAQTPKGRAYSYAIP